MAQKIRKAGAMWHGDLKNGKGTISTESQALYEQPYNYGMRFEDDKGTNPEELIAAAHSACYSMALANTLKKKGYDPQVIGTNAECTLDLSGASPVITHLWLHVRGVVPGISEADFAKIAKEADQGCPVSNLLRPGVEIEHEVELVDALESVKL